MLGCTAVYVVPSAQELEEADQPEPRVHLQGGLLCWKYRVRLLPASCAPLYC